MVSSMSGTLKMIQKDLEQLKNDVEVIKHVLIDEGELTAEAKLRLDTARKMPQSTYVRL